jgi:hypothetical protein
MGRLIQVSTTKWIVGLSTRAFVVLCILFVVVFIFVFVGAYFPFVWEYWFPF